MTAVEQYTAPRRACARIDWSDVPALQINRYQQKPPLPVAATAQLCWSDEAIHVRMAAEEPSILARFTGDYDMVCRDSCLETFLCPDADDGRYLNFEFNPNGACYFGFGYGRDDRLRLHPEHLRELLSVETRREGNRWYVRFDIPLAVLRLFMPDLTLGAGRRMRGNFYKCGDDITPPHELMWNPITNGNADFHQSAFFGDLLLGTESLK